MPQRLKKLPVSILSHLSKNVKELTKTLGDDKHKKPWGQDYFDLHNPDAADESEQSTSQLTPEKDGQKVAALQRKINQSIENFICLPQFTRYKLQRNDVMIIALAWEEHRRNHRGTFDWSDLCDVITLKNLDVKQQVDAVIELLDKHIMELDDELPCDYHFNSAPLMKADYRLHTDIVMGIMEIDFLSAVSKSMSAVWNTNQTFITDIMSAMQVIFKNYASLSSRSVLESMVYNYNIIAPNMHPILDRIHTEGKKFPLAKILKHHKLSFKEELLFIITFYQQYTDDSNPFYNTLMSYISDDYYDYVANHQYLALEGKLLSNSLLECEDRVKFRNQGRYNVSEVLYQRIIEFDLPTKGKSARSLKIIENDERFSLLKTQQTIDQLILPRATKATLMTAIQRCKHPEKYDLSRWGLMAPSLGTKKNETPGKGLVLLFHGVPGTGKTYAAGALANGLDKQLISIEASQLRSKWYGQTQQIIKSTFSKMRQLAQTDKNAPVFLLNEAEQLIHTRSDLSRSCAEVENSIQNIILEELETFPSIFIATTNLISNLDDAFFRRFHLKVEFTAPDAECRRQIWQAHLPKTIPGTTELDIDSLAEGFTFTGGQIRLVVENACAEAITRDGKEQRLMQHDLMKYAMLESGEQLEGKAKVIGFR